MEQAFNDNNRYNDQRFTELLDALTALDRRMTSAETAISRLEEAVYKKPEQTSQKVQADIVVTKDSLRKVRDAIMNIFR